MRIYLQPIGFRDGYIQPLSRRPQAEPTFCLPICLPPAILQESIGIAFSVLPLPADSFDIFTFVDPLGTQPFTSDLTPTKSPNVPTHIYYKIQPRRGPSESLSGDAPTSFNLIGRLASLFASYGKLEEIAAFACENLIKNEAQADILCWIRRLKAQLSLPGFVEFFSSSPTCRPQLISAFSGSS